MTDGNGKKIVHPYKFMVMGSKQKRFVGRVWYDCWFPVNPIKGLDFKMGKVK